MDPSAGVSGLDEPRRTADEGLGRECVTCGAPLAEDAAYCHRCGEKRRTPDDFALRRYLASFFRVLTETDGRLWRTLGYLLLHPGRLTVEWERGRRKPYLPPAQLFVLANAVYFVVQPLTGFGAYNTPLELQMDRQEYSEVLAIRERVESRAAERGEGLEAFRTRYDERSPVLARTMVFLMIPAFALALWALFPRRRRPFTKHLVQVTHFYAWDLLFIGSIFLMFWGFVGSGVARQVLGFLDPEGAPFLVLDFLRREWAHLPFLLFFFYQTARRTYGAGRLGAALRLPVLVLAYVAVTLLYRLFLFEATFFLV